ncbi:MAG TPA: hypothetical protein VNG90_04915 [Candidatus Acidoferrum sp.]|nr:hypothetical protein [Candidatus Acidoferrum sp.]
MKKIVLLVVIAALLIGWRTAGASSPVTIEGTVTDSGVPAAGIKLAIDCSGQLFANFIGFTFSDGSGRYVVHTDDVLCPLGTKVQVRADKDGDGKFRSSAIGVAKPLTVVNVELGKNFAVPEYGLLTSLLAMIVGAGLFWRARQRALQEKVRR